MNEPAEKIPLTPEAYLAWERQQLEKHEYFEGEVFAMAGASREHNLIVVNVVGELRNLLRKGTCEVYPSDLRVHVPLTGLYTYPDASVVCGRPELTDEQGDTLLNPSVLIEVLSPSSEGYDRGKKFEQYRSIASLRDYLLVSSESAHVEHYARQPDGSWLLRDARAGGRVSLSVGCTLEVDEVYLKVFEAPGE
jgi:Uma2 family endonuclease